MTACGPMVNRETSLGGSDNQAIETGIAMLKNNCLYQPN